MCCDAGGNIDCGAVKWLSLLVFFKTVRRKTSCQTRAVGCSQHRQERSTDALTFSAGAWDEGSLTPAQRGDPGPRGAAHHEQGAAGRQDAAGEPERLRLPAHPGAAQPRRRGEWPGGRPGGRSAVAVAVVQFC